MNKAYLVLENGATFCGDSFGAVGSTMAEVVFTTGMTGFLETLSDKSNYGHIVVQTFPLIGCYGVISSDFESDFLSPSAYIVKEWCQIPSNFRTEGDLDTFLKEKNIIGLCGIDTRALTKIIREQGAMNGVITNDPATVNFDELRAYKTEKAVATVSVKESYTINGEKDELNVAILDLGCKNSLINEIKSRVKSVTVCPFDTTAQQLKEMNIDAVVLSSGPSDPKENEVVIGNVKSMIEAELPILGICLGHSILALANGFDTVKLKYGHRGSNQPVKNLETGRVYITSQNNGFVVKSESINSATAKELYVNVNDKTCAGIKYDNINSVGIQFFPNTCEGHLNTGFIIDEFMQNIK